jgi:hypothetical protein
MPPTPVATKSHSATANSVCIPSIPWFAAAFWQHSLLYVGHSGQETHSCHLARSFRCDAWAAWVVHDGANDCSRLEMASQHEV